MQYSGLPERTYALMANFFLAILSAMLYALAGARLALSLLRGIAAPPRSRTLTLLLAGSALLLHCWVAWQRTGLPDTLNLEFFSALAVSAAGVVLLLLVLSLTGDADYLGLVVYPLAAISVLMSQISVTRSTPANPAVDLHVLLSLMAYTVLALAAVQALLVAVQRRLLHHHKPSLLRALPALDRTESLMFSLLGAGFLLLSLSLASGFAYLEDMFAQHLVHKTVLSTLAWLIFAVLLAGRLWRGWRGRRVVHWTIGGFIVLLVAYFGSKLVLELVLGGGGG